jgi:hypothetical protein
MQSIGGRARDETIDDAAVQIEGLSLWYGAKQAIDDVNLDVPRNQAPTRARTRTRSISTAPAAARS